MSSGYFNPVPDVVEEDKKVAIKDVVPAPVEDPNSNSDPSIVLSDPIDSATKLLIDLDVHVQTFIPAENVSEKADEAPTTVAIYSALDSDLDLSLTERQDQQQPTSVNGLLEQLDGLQNRIQVFFLKSIILHNIPYYSLKCVHYRKQLIN